MFNYPLHLNLSRPDIYFTAADGQTPLYYYLDSSSAAQNDSLACYVKVPQIPKEGAMIYLYYGVIAASPQPALSEAKWLLAMTSLRALSLPLLRGPEGEAISI